MNILLVAIGGALGSILRYLLGKMLPLKMTAVFPLGTFSVNLIGSFLIGVLGFFVIQKFINEEFRLFLIIGMLGGFTTFSSFGLDTFNMFMQKEYLKAFVYIFTTNIFGILLVFLGFIFSKFMSSFF